MTDAKLNKVKAEMTKITPYKTQDGWDRCGESSKYWLDYDQSTADSRLVNKKTGKTEWSYYADFYNGYN